jgi:hypothetical protein
MSAKIYGTGVFGITAEAGMYAQDLSVDYSIDETFLPDESGEDVAGAFTNAGASISITGFVNTGGSAFSSTLGASLAVANSLDASSFVTGASDDDAGETITTSVKLGYGNKAFKSFDVGGVFKPFMGTLQT